MSTQVWGPTLTELVSLLEEEGISELALSLSACTEKRPYEDIVPRNKSRKHT